jgi:L-alanine-DL-glutamate epimerase-like enolase superfamily enzyme
VNRRLTVRLERWPLAAPFVTSGGVYDVAECLVAEIEEGGVIGRGEGSPVEFKGETLESIAAAIEGVRTEIEAGLDRHALQTRLGPGGARNALDCALWALEAKRAGRRVSDLVGLANAGFQTVTTISLGPAEAMARQAASASRFAGLKLKLNADRPLERVQAVRAARPEARLICDVNGGWTRAELQRFAPDLAALGVEMIEQPLPPGDDRALQTSDSPIPLCADESCCGLDDLEALPAGYGAVCVKLDKTGGLTEALALANAATAGGRLLLVSNMIGTSLAMAPASLIAPMCRWVDLDGPLLLREDRMPCTAYAGDRAAPFSSDVWA